MKNKNSTFQPKHGEICVLKHNRKQIFSFNSHGFYDTAFLTAVYLMGDGTATVTNYEGDNHASVGYDAPIDRANNVEIALFNKYVKNS